MQNRTPSYEEEYVSRRKDPARYVSLSTDPSGKISQSNSALTATNQQNKGEEPSTRSGTNICHCNALFNQATIMSSSQTASEQPTQDMASGGLLSMLWLPITLWPPLLSIQSPPNQKSASVGCRLKTVFRAQQPASTLRLTLSVFQPTFVNLHNESEELPTGGLQQEDEFCVTVMENATTDCWSQSRHHHLTEVVRASQGCECAPWFISHTASADQTTLRHPAGRSGVIGQVRGDFQ